MKHPWTLALIMMVATTGPSQTSEETQEPELMPCADTGVFQSDYGFSVRIPAGLTGCLNSPSGIRRHGVLIPLDAEPGNAWVECYTGYADYETVSEALEFWLGTVRQHGEKVVILSRRSARLGRLPAQRAVLQYQVKDSGEELRREMVVGLRNVVSSQGYKITIEYLVDLVTPETRYAADRLKYNKILSSWKTEPTLDGP